MASELLIALAGLAFVSSITPGPNNLMLMASGINYGIGKTLPHMLGIVFGFSFMILLVGLGLTTIFDAFPVTYIILKVISIGYLSYLAWKIATAAPLKNNHEAIKKPMTFLQAALFQFVNPKAWVMIITAISTYSTTTNSMINILIIIGVFCSIMLPSISVWAFLGTQIKRLLNNPMKLRAFNITAGILLIASLYPVIFL